MIELLLASQLLNLYTFLYYNYLYKNQAIPILSKEDSKELLKSLLESGVYKVNDLKMYGIRNCDIQSCFKERQKIRALMIENKNTKSKVHYRSLKKIEKSIEKRQLSLKTSKVQKTPLHFD